MKMLRISMAIVPLLVSAASAFAQMPQSSIRESTDPSRVAEVERRAQEIRGGQSPMGSPGMARMPQPMAEEHGRMHHKGMRHHGRRHGDHAMHHKHPKGAPDAAK